MKKRWTALTAVPGMIMLLMAGCSVGNHLADSNLTAAAMAEVASLTMEYDEKAMEVEAALLELEEAEADAEPGTGTPLRATVVFVPSGEPERILPDGTEVYVVRELLDKGTPDEEDDEVQSTRYFILDGEQVYREVVIRPVKPGADWSLWDDAGQAVQFGETRHYSGTSVDPFRTGSLEVTWKKDGDEVFLTQIVKDSVHLVNMTTVITTISIEGDVATKEQVRIRVTDGDHIVVHAFLYEQFEEDGIQKNRIIRDDGAWAVRWEEDGTWYVLCYDADGILVRERIETGTLVERSITVHIYDATGTDIVETRSMNVSFRAGEDGSVVVTRTLDDGRVAAMSIREGGRGYIVSRDGSSYVVAVDLTTGTVTISDIRGGLIATIILNDDGSWTVLTSGGDVAYVDV